MLPGTIPAPIKIEDIANVRKKENIKLFDVVSPLSITLTKEIMNIDITNNKENQPPLIVVST